MAIEIISIIRLNRNIEEKLTLSINIPLSIGPNAIPKPNDNETRFIVFPSTSYSAAILIVKGKINVQIYLNA